MKNPAGRSGSFAAEYAATRSGAGCAAGANGLFWVTGRDAITYLQGVISQDIVALSPGDVARSFLLQPRGKLEALFWVLRGEDRVGIFTDAANLEETINALSRWRMRVEVELSPDPRPVFDVWGPAPAALDVGDGWIDENGVLVAETRRAPLRHRLVAGLTHSDLALRGVAPISEQVHTTLRIETGEPRFGTDIDRRTIPQESGLVPEAVSFTKGCFLGQELVARIDSRGRVNRHLLGARILDGVTPPVGARLVYGTKVVGTLTSVGESPAVGGPAGLAMVRREAPPGTRVEVSWEEGEAIAVIERLPLLSGDSAGLYAPE